MAANFPLIILALTVVIWAFVTMVMRVSNGPTNILLGSHGVLKIVDFGCGVNGMSRNTLCGKPEYLAPEMITVHMRGGRYDERVDIWSLGILMYELLVGVGQALRLYIDRIRRVGYTLPGDVHLAILLFLSLEA
ncbi:Aurora kinase A [Colletotrichum fructicola]|nr:Aurora kinase A [Colletotrichum fructicola]